MRITNTLLVVFSIIGMISCSNSEPEESNGILTGEFIEITPENDRTTLIFSSVGNQLQEKRITDGENPVSRTFSIRLLKNNMLELSRNEADEQFPRVFHYRTINGNKFEIGNINKNDTENTVMLFERI